MLFWQTLTHFQRSSQKWCKNLLTCHGNFIKLHRLCNGQLNVMIDEILQVQTKLQQEFSADIVIANLPGQLFHYFKTSTDIVSKNKYQGLPLYKGPSVIRLHEHKLFPSTHAGILKQVFSFGSRYLALLRNNWNSRFDCVTMQVCRSFKSIFDPTLYFYPRSDSSNINILSDFASFERFF